MSSPENSDHRSAAKSTPIIETVSDIVDIERLINLLRAKMWLVLTITAIVFLAAFGYVLRAPRIYESKAIIQVDQIAQKVVNIDEISQDNMQSSEYLNTVVQAFTSAKLMQRVVRANQLQDNPNFAPPRADGKKYSESELAGRLGRKVEVKLRRGTRLLDVIVEDENPVMAQELAASLVKEFIRESFDQKLALSKVASEFLRDETEILKKKLETSERKLQAYKEENKAVSLEERQNIIVEKLKEVSSMVTEAKSRRLAVEADIEQLKKIDKSDPETLLGIKSVSQIPQVAMINEQLLNGESELAILKQRYLEKHPKYIAATTRNANLRESLVREAAKAEGTLSKQYEAALDAESKLEGALRDQEQVALELNKIAIPFNVLQRDVESDRALYDSMTKRLKETAITQGIEQSPFRIIEEPLVPSRPSKPQVKIILLVALVLGGMLGVGIVIGLDVVDHSLRTIDEAEHYLGLPALGAIPDTRDTEVSEKMKEVWKDGRFDASKLGGIPGAFLKKKIDSSRKMLSPKKTGGEERERHPLVLLENPGSLQSEAIRSLRTSLSLLGKQETRRSFLVTSAVPSEGKSFTSLNLAHSFAQQGLKTVIVDADLRRPKLKDDLLPKVGDVAGLTDYLSGQAKLPDVIRKTAVDNLSLLPAGHRSPNPAELLSGADFSEVVQNLLKLYDRVVIDTPPVNAVSDVLLLASHVQTVCLVVRAGKTSKKAIARAVQQLEKSGGQIAGFIFNRLPIGGPSAAYYYYYYGDEYSKDSVYGTPTG